MRIALIAAAAMMSSSAMAADLYFSPEPEIMMSPTPASYDWTGFYIGAFGGWGGGSKTGEFMNNGFQATADEDEFFLTDDPTIWYPFAADTSGTGYWEGDWEYEGGIDDAAGGFIGATVGYNAQFDSFVLGIEGDVAWANISADGESYWEYDYGGANYGNTETYIESSLDAFATLRGRAGLAIDRFMPYVTAGVAWGSVTTSIESYNFNNIAAETEIEPTSASESLFGWTAGIGAEYAITDSIRVKAEYSYLDLGTSEATFEYSDDNGPYTLSLDHKYHTVKLGLNFAF